MIKLPTVGMRIIKTAIAVSICALTFSLLKRENATLACIAAIITLQNTLENSFINGRNRVLSTILGGILAIIFMYVGLVIPNIIFTAIFIPIGVSLIIYTCAHFNKKELIVITSVVFLTITINYLETTNSLYYALNRILDTTFGVIVSLIINILIKTPEIKLDEGQNS